MEEWSRNETMTKNQNRGGGGGLAAKSKVMDAFFVHTEKV